MLANDKDKYLTLFESIEDPVFVLDQSGGIENLNTAAWRLLGMETDPGEIYYRPNGEFPGRERIEALLAGQPLTDGTTIKLQTADGRRSFDVHRREILDIGDKYSGSVLIFNDVTAHRQALAEIEQVHRAKSAFLATVSHEIRTPLNGILGAVRLLRRGSLTPEQESYTKAIARSGERLQALINNVLDYSKIEAGKLSLEANPFSLREILDNVVAIMAPHAQELGHELILEAPSLAAGTVLGDACKLQQVLLNLVGNALKFSERGDVILRLCAGSEMGSEPESTSGDLIRFEVEDRGPGMTAAERQRLFQPFTQIHRPAPDRDRGSGLGLAICRHLAEIMGAQIGVRPARPRGSLFWIELPLPTVAEPIAPVCTETTTPAADRPLSVLLVEDDEVNQLVASGLLECDGHRVTLAATGREALAALSDSDVDGRGSEFDAVVLDIRLPDMDGFDVAQQIRQLTGWSLPIVAVTAHVARQELTRRDSIDALIIKPFDPHELQQTLARLVEQGEAPLLDQTILREHMENLGDERTARIVAAFSRTCARGLAELNSGCIASPGQISAIAHRVRGCANGLGLRRLARQAALVEAAADQASDPQLALLLDDLRSSMVRSRGALKDAWRDLRAETGPTRNPPGPAPQTDSPPRAGS
ncbi:MAG: histidine kinase dimerization/phospho-acceptor domain-containing protein [Thiohalocapsa sp.]